MISKLQPFLLSILILSLQILQASSSSTCSNYLIDSTQATLSCGSAHLYTSTDLTIPSPYKILAVSFTLEPTSYCVTGGSDVVLFSVLITPPGTTTQKKIMSASYVYSTSTIHLAAEDSSGLQSITSQSVSTFLNEPITIYIGVDLTSSSPSIKYFLGAGDFGKADSLTTQSYGSDWVFDSSTVMSICADENGDYGVHCVVQNLKVAYRIPVQSLTLPFSNAMTMVGNYLINEKSGTSLKNSQGTLGSASLSSPVWTSDYGLEFDSNSNQYVKITNFIPSGEAFYATTSVAFAFYLRIDSAPTTDALIVSHWVKNLGTEILNLALTSTMTLKLTLDGTSAETPEKVPVGEWATIYVFYVFTQGGFARTRVYIDGASTSAIPDTVSSLVSLDFSAADTVKIGGAFSGNLKRIQVYSPASVGFASGDNLCDSSTCSLEIGYSDPRTCLEAVCSAGYYPIFESCEACPTNCATCTDPETCQSCNSGYYLVSKACIQCPTGRYIASITTCADCPTHCRTCTSSSVCTSCDSSYGIYGNLCMLCPSGTYLSSNQICREFSETLQDTLTSSQLVNSAATQIASIISQGSAISLSAAISGRIFSQIKYLDISYSGELQVALLTWKTSFVSLGLTPNMPESMEDKIPARHIPYVFEKYDVPSSFLINFWENLGVVVFVASLWSLFRGVEYCISMKTHPRAASVGRKARTMTQNFLITVLYGVYGDIVMYSIIEYRSLVFGWNLSLLSFLISFILVIIMFVSFLYQIKLLLTYQKLKRQNNLLKRFVKNHEGSQAYWKDFKDYSLAPQLFLFFLSGRDLMLSLILATMFEYPLAQTIIFTLLGCLMIVYLFIKKPFESTFDFVQQLFFEFIGLIVNISVGINAVLDAGKYEASGARNNIGKLIIICNLIFNFVTAVFMLMCIGQVSIEFYKNMKRRRVKKLEVLKRQTRAQIFEKSALQDLNIQTRQNLHSDQTFIPDNNTSQNLSFQLETSELKLLSNQSQKPKRAIPSKKTKNQELDLHVRYNPTQVTEGSQSVFQPRRNHIIQRKNKKTRGVRPRLNINSTFQPDLEK